MIVADIVKERILLGEDMMNPQEEQKEKTRQDEKEKNISEADRNDGLLVRKLAHLEAQVELFGEGKAIRLKHDEPALKQFYDQTFERLNQLLSLPLSTRQFPGPTARCLFRSDVDKVYDGDRTYWARLEPDGVRYALLMFETEGHPRVVIIDEALQAWLIRMPTLKGWRDGTILDGYVVPLKWMLTTTTENQKRDKSKKEITNTFGFVITDVLVKDGRAYHREPDYHRRLCVARQFEQEADKATNVANSACIPGHGPGRRREDTQWCFQFLTTEIGALQDQPILIKHVLPVLPYTCQGLVWMSGPESIRFGHHKHMYYWRRSAAQSVALRIKLKSSAPSKYEPIFKPSPGALHVTSESTIVELWCLSADGRVLLPYTSTVIHLSDLESQFGVKDIKELHKRIAHCRFNRRQKIWEVWRLLNNRLQPNTQQFIDTIQSVIRENLPLANLMPDPEAAATFIQDAAFV
jgi:hypothetical protein